MWQFKLKFAAVRQLIRLWRKFELLVRVEVSHCVEDRRWKIEDGRWKMEDGRWKMEDGRWEIAASQQFELLVRVQAGRE